MGMNAELEIISIEEVEPEPSMLDLRHAKPREISIGAEIDRYRSKAGPQPPDREIECKTCSRKFVEQAGLFLTWIFPSICEKCGAAQDKAMMSRYNRKTAEFNDFMPKEFHNFDHNKARQEFVMAAARWMGNVNRKPGFGFLGHEGQGKSRVMWFLVAELRQAGNKVLAFTPEEFEHSIQETNQLVKEAATAQYILIDDIGLPLGLKAETELYYVIQQRVKRTLPILWTADGALGGNEKTSERRKAIRKKLMECSTVTRITKPAEAA